MNTQHSAAADVTKPMELLTDILRFEADQMSEDELIPFFQALVDTGMAWQLQGSYGRTAHELLVQGIIRPRTQA